MKNTEIKHHQIKVNLPGGIISVGDFSSVLEILENAGIQQVRFGTRQQLYFSATAAQLEDITHGFLISDTDFETDLDHYPNMVSSYVTEDLFNNPDWLREGVYKDILDAFDYNPRLKINLAGDSQALIPFFSGNLNFISSDIGNYWHLYVRFPKTNIIHYWPSLVCSEDIAILSKAIESVIFEDTHLYYDQPEIDGQQLETAVRLAGNFLFQPSASPLRLPDFQLPYYEGFNRYNEKYWLGIYRRNEIFTVSFLKDLCEVCCKTRIGQVYTTPWKSLIIKGVEPTDRKLWNVLLDKHRVNVRHASNELNWQTEDLCEEGLRLKHELIHAFNEHDLRTFRLCFAIKINPKSGLFGSVIIRKQTVKESQESFFDLLHTVDFNPNSKHYIMHTQGVSKAGLFPALAQLCENYYELQTLTSGIQVNQHYEAEGTANQEPTCVQQCRHCLSIALPDDDNCPVCDAPPDDFISINKETLNTF